MIDTTLLQAYICPCCKSPNFDSIPGNNGWIFCKYSNCSYLFPIFRVDLNTIPFMQNGGDHHD